MDIMAEVVMQHTAEIVDKFKRDIKYKIKKNIEIEYFKIQADYTK